MVFKGWLRRLERGAQQDHVLIRQQDGTVKAFDRQHVMGELYLSRVDAALGRPPHSSEVMAALANATPESRAAVEEIGKDSVFLKDLEPLGDDEEVEDLSEQRETPSR